jgi:hypothetical protein
MKKFILLLLIISFLVVLNLRPCSAGIKPQVKPYNVSAELKEVANLNQFDLTPEMKRLLAKNLFVVAPAQHWQPFFVYEDNDYRFVPSFVTVDSVLHIYHLFFNFALRRLEEEKLLPIAKELTMKLFEQSKKTYQKAPNEQLKNAARRNMAYIGVAAKLLGLKLNIPEEIKQMVETELKLIKQHETLRVGAILPYAVDYSQFIPRGHYTRTEKLKKYFYTVMWYGLFPFSPRYRDDTGELFWTPEVTRQALLFTNDLYEAKLTDLWDKLYSPINFFVGFGDDLRPDEVKQLSDTIFGVNADLSHFADVNRFEKFMHSFIKLRMPGIKPKAVWIASGLPPLPDPNTPQLRLLGQRYVPDSEILQELVEISEKADRPVPKGLDVMAVFGSKRAEWLLDTFYQEPKKWDGYLPERKKLTEKFNKLDEKQWKQNLYWSWLQILKSLLNPVKEGYPSFMRTDAWQDKSLQTALASWAQLRHDTILYVKQSLIAAECGDGGEEKLPPKPKGYVEPNPEAYSRLLKLAQQTRSLLEPRGLLTKEMADKLREFEDMLTFLKRIAEKELQNQPLASQEYEQIRLIGSTMDYLALWVVSGGKATEWDEIVHPADRNMATIADVHTAVDRRPGGAGEVVLEEGVGHAFEIYVVVPIEGKLYLTRGAVFSYYEFTHPMQNRLTDEKWQDTLEKKKAPQQPEWIKLFTVPEPRKKPVVAKPYFSGC